MKVAIYHMVIDPIRTSCIDLQIDILKQFAKDNNWEIEHIYLDKTNVEENKNELNLLLENSSKGLFDIVLMKNAYYISRHTSKYVSIRNYLHSNGVKLITLCEGEC